MQVIELLSAIGAAVGFGATGVVAIWSVARAMAALVGNEEDGRG